MAVKSWSQTSSGSFAWTTASNWLSNAAPGRGDDAVLQPSVSQTIGFSVISLQLNSLTVGGNALFSMNGGTLSTLNGATIVGGLAVNAGLLRLGAQTGLNALGGNITQSGGNLTISGGGFAQGGTYTQTGGTLTVNNGTFTTNDTGTLAGTLAGNGRLILSGAPGNNGVTFTNATSFQVARLTFQGQQNWAAGFLKSYAGTFEQTAGAVTNLNGGALSLSGRAALRGRFTSGGTVIATAGGVLNQLTLDNGVIARLTGIYNQTGDVQLGAGSTGTLSVTSGALLRLVGNVSLSGANGVLINNGVISKVGGANFGGSVSRISSLVQSSNTSTFLAGEGTTLAFSSPASNGQTSTLAGVLGGQGTILFDSGQYLASSTGTTSNLALTAASIVLQQSAIVSLTVNNTIGNQLVMQGGTLVVGSPASPTQPTLTLGGEVVLETGLLKGTGTVLSSGTVRLANADIEGNLTVNFNGATQTILQTGNIQLANQTGAIVIANVGAGSTWQLAGNSNILSISSNTGTINNAGRFIKTSGSANSVVQGQFNSTGTLSADSGTLLLTGAGSLGGTITGGSVLALGGAYTLAAGAKVTVADLEIVGGITSLGGNITFNNAFGVSAGATLYTAGSTLTLTGPTTLQGIIQGSGSVFTAGDTLLGPSVNLTQGARLVVSGTAEQTGNIIMTAGPVAPNLTVAKSGVYLLDPGASIGTNNPSPLGTVSVGGRLTLDGPTQSTIQASTINAAVVNTGTISISSGELRFLSSLSGTGVTSIGDGGTLDLLGTTKILSTITFGAGPGALELGNPNLFIGKIAGFGSGDLIELANFNFLGSTLTLSDNGLRATVTQTGGTSVTITFTTAQTKDSLFLAAGPHGFAAIVHG